ncbi:hypothetical protein [Streptomyces sp. NPDC048638]|uniref:hypothetical protein n=1 Tax=Streptomyces sp. NPDC048638 TaxID=3365580 RepID=UPI0037192DBC
MDWFGRSRSNDELRKAAYRAQLAIVSNPGHGAWTSAWSEPQGARRYGADTPDTPRLIAGPLLARSHKIDEALGAVMDCTPPADLTDILLQARLALVPMLELSPVWIAHLTSRLEDRGLSGEALKDALGMDMEFGGFLLEGWEHEDAAINAVIAAAPLLDQVHQALVPHSRTDWLARATG